MRRGPEVADLVLLSDGFIKPRTYYLLSPWAPNSELCGFMRKFIIYGKTISPEGTNPHLLPSARHLDVSALERKPKRAPTADGDNAVKS